MCGFATAGRWEGVFLTHGLLVMTGLPVGSGLPVEQDAAARDPCS